MGTSEIYLLLPVSDEIQDFPYLERFSVMEHEELKEYINEINGFMKFFDYEPYEGYYDGENIKGFLHPVIELEDCYPNIRTYFRTVMKKWGEDWRMTKKQNPTKSYKYYSLSIQNDTLCEITERKCTIPNDNTYLLINHKALKNSEKAIRTVCNDKIVDIDIIRLNVKDFAKWIEVNRVPQRIFSWNPKHGEFGKGAHPDNKGDKVSVLKGSRTEAKELLKKAVGHEFSDTLYFRDLKYNAYIEYKRESINTYHAFHIDAEDEKRIPLDIKEKISTLMGGSPKGKV